MFDLNSGASNPKNQIPCNLVRICPENVASKSVFSSFKVDSSVPRYCFSSAAAALRGHLLSEHSKQSIARNDDTSSCQSSARKAIKRSNSNYSSQKTASVAMISNGKSEAKVIAFVKPGIPRTKSMVKEILMTPKRLSYSDLPVRHENERTDKDSLNLLFSDLLGIEKWKNQTSSSIVDVAEPQLRQTNKSVPCIWPQRKKTSRNRKEKRGLRKTVDLSAKKVGESYSEMLINEMIDSQYAEDPATSIDELSSSFSDSYTFLTSQVSPFFDSSVLSPIITESQAAPEHISQSSSTGLYTEAEDNNYSDFEEVQPDIFIQDMSADLSENLAEWKPRSEPCKSTVEETPKELEPVLSTANFESLLPIEVKPEDSICAPHLPQKCWSCDGNFFFHTCRRKLNVDKAKDLNHKEHKVPIKFVKLGMFLWSSAILLIYFSSGLW